MGPMSQPRLYSTASKLCLDSSFYTKARPKLAHRAPFVRTAQVPNVERTGRLLMVASISVTHKAEVAVSYVTIRIRTADARTLLRCR
jgi:hypothetical protein